MSYSRSTEMRNLQNQTVEKPVVSAVVDYHDRIRWGPIFAGIVTAIATQLILSALGAAVGLTAGAAGTDAGVVGAGVGIWSIISLLIALFLGGLVCANSCGPMNSKTALLHGLVLWATTLAIKYLSKINYTLYFMKARFNKLLIELNM